MLLQSWAAVFLLAASAASQDLPSLVDALQAEGATQFATFIQSDPDLLTLYTSGQVKTVFAPADSASILEERALSPREQRAAKYQAAKEETSVIEASQSLPGLTIETADESQLLDSQGNVVVADSRPDNPSNSTGSARRWNSQFNSRYQSNETAQSLLKISSGLGNIANIIKGDIPFEGGLIHIMDSYFTLPESLSSTSEATGQTSFASLSNSTNQTSTLDTTHSVTVFMPSNEAFSSSPNGTTPPAQLLANHVVPGFVGYLPDLTDGAVLKTQAGESLVISVRDGQYFVNGAKITTANLILENGVAHVIDKVLTPSTPPPVISGGALSVKAVGLACTLGAVGGLALLALF